MQFCFKVHLHSHFLAITAAAAAHYPSSKEKGNKIHAHIFEGHYINTYVFKVLFSANESTMYSVSRQDATLLSILTI